MANSRKLFHIEGVFDASVLHEVMMLADGKSYDLKVTAVKADFDQETGAPKERKSLRLWFVEYILDHPQFKIIEARHASKAAGYPPTGIYGVVNAALKDGVLKRIGTGTYAVIQKAMNGAHHAAANGAKPVVDKTLSGRDILIKTLKATGQASVKDIRAAFVAHGRSAKSVNDQLGKLKAAKEIKGIGRGLYELRAAS